MKPQAVGRWEPNKESMVSQWLQNFKDILVGNKGSVQCMPLPSSASIQSRIERPGSTQGGEQGGWPHTLLAFFLSERALCDFSGEETPPPWRNIGVLFNVLLLGARPLASQPHGSRKGKGRSGYPRCCLGRKGHRAQKLMTYRAPQPSFSLLKTLSFFLLSSLALYEKEMAKRLVSGLAQAFASRKTKWKYSFIHCATYHEQERMQL